MIQFFYILVCICKNLDFPILVLSQTSELKSHKLLFRACMAECKLSLCLMSLCSLPTFFVLCWKRCIDLFCLLLLFVLFIVLCNILFICL